MDFLISIVCTLALLCKMDHYESQGRRPDYREETKDFVQSRPGKIRHNVTYNFKGIKLVINVHFPNLSV